MKKRFSLIILVLAAVLLLSGCVMGPRAESAPGLTADETDVYIAYRQYVHKIDLNTGLEKWRYPERGNNTQIIYAPPLEQDGKLLVGDLANKLSQISAETGVVEWTFIQAKGWFQAQPAKNGDLIVAPNSDRNIYGISNDGSLKWTYKSDFGFLSQPRFSENKVIVSSLDHKVIAVDTSNGNELWSFPLKGSVVSSALVNEKGKTIYVGSIGKDFAAIDLESGNEKWSFDAGGSLGSVWGAPVMIENLVVFADESGKIYALDPASGKSVWTADAGGTTVVGPVQIPDGFVIALEDGTIRSYDSKGNPGWAQKVDGQVFSMPVVSGDIIVIGVVKSDYLAYALDLKGNRIWSFNSSNKK